MFTFSTKQWLLALTVAAIAHAPSSALAQSERWFEVEIYLYEHDSSRVEQWPDNVKAPRQGKTVDFIGPLISTDLTAVNMGLNGCSASDWATDSLSCREQLNTQSQAKTLSKIPKVIAAAHPATAHLGDGAVLLANSQSQFNNIIATIEKEKGTHSLLHMTWQQSMLPRNKAIPIRIYAGNDYSDQYQFNGQALRAADQNTELSQFHFLNHGPFAQPQSPVWELDGTLTIYLEHYLFIEAALNLREEGEKTATLTRRAEQINTSADLQQASVTRPFLYSIPLQQNRRVRSGEFHYFDHPKLGMVIQIRKMQQPTARVTPAATPTVERTDVIPK